MVESAANGRFVQNFKNVVTKIILKCDMGMKIFG